MGDMRLISYEGYEPRHLSYSTMDGYRTCGERFRLQKVLQVEQRPGLAALGGNAVHTATEWYDLGDERGHNMLSAFDSETAFRHAWDEEVEKRREQSPSFEVSDYVKTGRASAQYGGKRNLDWWMDNGPGMVQKWIDWRNTSGWHLWETPEGVPAVELELNVEISEDIIIKMFLDRVMVTQAGQIVVVDIKTGRLPETGEQLGLYALGLRLEYGEMFRPDWGYYWSPDKGHGSPVPLGMYTQDHFVSLAHNAAAGINAGSFMAKPANNCRSWCGVAQFCAAVGGTPPQA